MKEKDRVRTMHIKVKLHEALCQYFVYYSSIEMEHLHYHLRFSLEGDRFFLFILGTDMNNGT